MNACTQPSEGINPDDILAILIDIPPIPTPPMTSENSQNNSFQRTLGYCQKVVIYREETFDKYVQSLLEEEVLTYIKQDTIWWAGPKLSADYVHTFRVVVRDTLRVRVNCIDIFQPDKVNYVEGWIIPNGESGYFKRSWGSPEVHWWQEKEYSVVRCKYMSWSYVLVDSLFGGGNLYVSEMMTGIFEAHWDVYGHGYCSTGSW